MSLAKSNNKNYSVESCHLRDLLQSARPSTRKQPVSSTIATHSTVWHTIQDLPVKLSTCVAVQGIVLAIGRIDQQDKKSTAVYELNTDNNKLSYKYDMNIARSLCMATILPDRKIVVVGGLNE